MIDFLRAYVIVFGMFWVGQMAEVLIHYRHNLPKVLTLTNLAYGSFVVASMINAIDLIGRGATPRLPFHIIGITIGMIAVRELRLAVRSPAGIATLDSSGTDYLITQADDRLKGIEDPFTKDK